MCFQNLLKNLDFFILKTIELTPMISAAYLIKNKMLGFVQTPNF